MRTLIFLLVCLVFSSMQGCATLETLSEARPGDPRIFGGTRLNVNAIKNKESSVGDLHVEPVEHPVLDLPFSFVLDVVLLPYSLSTVIYDKMFHH